MKFLDYTGLQRFLSKLKTWIGEHYQVKGNYVTSVNVGSVSYTPTNGTVTLPSFNTFFKCYAYGNVYTINTLRYTIKTYNNKSMTVTRRGPGWVRISIPSSWSLGTNYIVLITGLGRTEGRSDQDGSWYGIKATVLCKTSTYFEVALADDESGNEGEFDFILLSTKDVQL